MGVRARLQAKKKREEQAFQDVEPTPTIRPEKEEEKEEKPKAKKGGVRARLIREGKIKPTEQKPPSEIDTLMESLFVEPEEAQAFQDVEPTPTVTPEPTPVRRAHAGAGASLDDADKSIFQQAKEMADESRLMMGSEQARALVGSFGTGMGGSLIAENIDKFLGTEIKKKIEDFTQEEKYPVTSAVGKFGGFVVPASLASKLASRIPQVARIGKDVLRIGAQETVAGLGLGTAESALRGEGVGETLQRAGLYGATGGVGGAAITAVTKAIGKTSIGKALKRKFGGAKPVAREAVEETPVAREAVEETVEAQPGLLPEEVVPERPGMLPEEIAIGASGAERTRVLREAAEEAQPGLLPEEVVPGVPREVRTRAIREAMGETTEAQPGLLPEEVVPGVPREARKSVIREAVEETAEAPTGLLPEEAATRLRGFRERTLPSSGLLETPEFKNVIDELDEAVNPRYTVKGHTETMQKAADMVNNNYDGTLNRLITQGLSSSEDTAAAGLLMKDLKNKLVQNIDDPHTANQIKKLTEKVQTQGTELGQTIEAFKTWKWDTTEGALLNAQRTVKGALDDVLKRSPRTANKVTKDTNEITNVVNRAKSNAATEAVTKALDDFVPPDLEAKKLARQISGTVAPKKPKADPLKAMVRELFKVAKESPLPPKKIYKTNPAEYLKLAVQNNEKYTEVWEGAKKIVSDKFKNNPEAMAILDDYFNKGIVPPYAQETVERTVKFNIKELGQNLTKIAKSGNLTREAARKELTEEILEITGVNGDDATALANNIQKIYDGLLKDRASLLLNNMANVTKSTEKKKIIEKVTEAINLGVYDDATVKSAVLRGYKLPDLTPDDVRQITQGMETAGKLTGKAKEIEILKVQQLIANKEPATVGEKIRAFLTMAMIFNPITLITRNPLSNAVLGLIADNIKDIPGAGIDALTSKIAGSERTTIIGLKEKFKGNIEGIHQGLMDMIDDIKYGVDTSPTRGMMELPKKRIYESDTLHAIHTFLGRALKFGDRPFYQGAKNARINELKTIKGTNIVTPNMEDEATLLAFDKVFQNDSVLATVAKNIKKSLGIVGDAALPFTQTPANILDKFLDYSPVGFGKALYHLGATGGIKGSFNQKLFVDRVARALTGTTIALLGYAAATHGVIEPGADRSEKVRAFEKMIGKIPYSMKFGDEYVSFDWAQPVGTILAAGADAYFAGLDKDSFLAKLKTGVEAGLNTGVSQSLFRGILGAADRANPVTGLFKLFLGATTQASPSVLAQARKLADELERETHDPSIMLRQLKKIINRTPGLSRVLPAKRDPLGKEIKILPGEGIVSDIFNSLFNPAKTSTLKLDATTKEISRIYEETGDAKHLPRIAPKKLKGRKTRQSKLETIELSGKEYADYQRRIGEETKNRFGTFIRSGAYKRMNDEGRSKVLQKILRDVSSKAKNKFLRDKGFFP